MIFPIAQALARSRRLLRGEGGSSLTEAAITLPLLVMAILWSIYFWEVQQARIKAAEAARFLAFEVAAGRDRGSVMGDVRARFADLDSTDKEPPGSGAIAGYHNTLALVNVDVHTASAPLSSASLQDKADDAGVSGITSVLSKAISLIGNSVGAVVNYLGFSTGTGAVSASVEFKMTNHLVPSQIGLLTSAGGSDGLNRSALDLTFKDQYWMYFDTWRAWRFHDPTGSTYPRVEERTYEHVRPVAYLGILSNGGQVLNTIGEFLEGLELEFPLSDTYIRESVLIGPVEGEGRYWTPSNASYRPTRTVPGTELQGLWWVNDSCFCYGSSCTSDGSSSGFPFLSGCDMGGGDRESSFPNVLRKRGVLSSGDHRDNFTMRSHYCRGDFFEGLRRSDRTELEIARGDVGLAQQYYLFGSQACRAGDPLPP
ncbi:MAG: pilus assembly protein [Deltaproteobacteria bacterium]|nr:pilus assembly protein [Deltaproteobacteria bacterium]